MLEIIKKRYNIGHIRKILLFALTIIIITALLIEYYIILGDFKSYQLDMIKNNSDRAVTELEIGINHSLSRASRDLSHISENVEANIRKEFGNDMDALKKKLDKDDYSDLANAIEPYIKAVQFSNGTEHNTIFAATYKGIICDYNYTYVNMSDSEVDENTYRHWQTLVDDSYNKKSCQSAIDKLINRSSEEIIWQYREPGIDIDLDLDLSKITIEDLKKIYLKYGAEGLSSFDILVPTYITEDGDIFGQDDISMGVRYDNYKIIIVQRINMYDQIMSVDSEIYNFSTVSQLESNYEEIMCKMYILGITIIIVFIVILIHYIGIFNKIFKNEYESNS